MIGLSVLVVAACATPTGPKIAFSGSDSQDASKWVVDSTQFDVDGDDAELWILDEVDDLSVPEVMAGALVIKDGELNLDITQPCGEVPAVLAADAVPGAACPGGACNSGYCLPSEAWSVEFPLGSNKLQFVSGAVLSDGYARLSEFAWKTGGIPSSQVSWDLILDRFDGDGTVRWSSPAAVGWPRSEDAPAWLRIESADSYVLVALGAQQNSPDQFGTAVTLEAYDAGGVRIWDARVCSSASGGGLGGQHIVWFENTPWVSCVVGGNDVLVRISASGTAADYFQSKPHNAIVTASGVAARLFVAGSWGKDAISIHGGDGVEIATFDTENVAMKFSSDSHNSPEAVWSAMGRFYAFYRSGTAVGGTLVSVDTTGTGLTGVDLPGVIDFSLGVSISGQWVHGSFDFDVVGGEEWLANLDKDGRIVTVREVRERYAWAAFLPGEKLVAAYNPLSSSGRIGSSLSLEPARLFGIVDPWGNPSGGLCWATPVSVCDDGNTCTVDDCTELEQGCTNTTRDDGAPCLGLGVCSSGTCLL